MPRRKTILRFSFPYNNMNELSMKAKGAGYYVIECEKDYLSIGRSVENRSNRRFHLQITQKGDFCNSRIHYEKRRKYSDNPHWQPLRGEDIFQLLKRERNRFLKETGLRVVN